MAAEQGFDVAQFNLGLKYANGQGVPVDNIEAHLWWSLAARQGNKAATLARKIVAGKMTPEQIAVAEKFAREWKPK